MMDSGADSNDFNLIKKYVKKKLLLKLDVSVLLKLRKYFYIPLKTDDSEEFTKSQILQIDEDRFVKAINTIYGHNEYSSNSAELFQSLVLKNNNTMYWDDLLNEILDFACNNIKLNNDTNYSIIKPEIKIDDLKHCKKESIAIIVPIETQTTFCYVVISKFGKVGIYDGNFSFLTEYDIFFVRSGINRRVRDIWITASIYLPDNKSLIITSSDNCMMIYDASTLCHLPIFLITGITSTPTCLSYKQTDNLTNLSNLVIGDDSGSITTITFKQPSNNLFYKKNPDGLNKYFWIQLQDSTHEPFCKIKTLKRIHSRPVKKVAHIYHNNTIISCSSDPETSIMIRHSEGITDPYIFKVAKGVNCFHYSEILKILATGSSDGCVRLWEPVVTFKPSTIFSFQQIKIVDVLILAHMYKVLSININGVLKIWDMLNHSCIQSINIPYPSFGILGKPIQFGVESIYCGPGRTQTLYYSSKKYTDVNEIIELFKWNRKEIIVTCCNHIAIIQLEKYYIVEKESIYKEMLKNDFGNILPPPLKMYRQRRPSIWEDVQVQNSLSNIKNNKSITSSEETYKICSNNKVDLHSFDFMLDKIGLSNIINKDFIAGSKFKHDMNVKFAMQNAKRKKMRLPISQGAPFTALDLHDDEKIKFSIHLPISEKMKVKTGLEYFTNPQQLIKFNKCLHN